MGERGMAITNHASEVHSTLMCCQVKNVSFNIIE